MKYFTQLKHQLLAFCLLLFVTNPNAQSLEYPSKKNYQLVIGGTTGLIKPNGDHLQQAGIMGMNLGFATQAQFSANYSLWFGITYAFIETGDYQNTKAYTTEWVSGMYTQDILLKTTIKQQFIQVPVFVHRNMGRFFLGGGFTLSYLTTAYTEQEVLGTYAPHPNHPNGFINYNKSIETVFNADEYNTAPFQKVNITPAVLCGYQISKRIGIQLNIGYDVLKNPAYTNIPFNSYRQLLTNLLLTFKAY